MSPVEPASFAPAKSDVRDFWNEESCGEALLLPSDDKAGFESQARERYRLEPYIPEFARFSDSRDKRVLEIGVGLGADHQQFAKAGADLSGIDLTPRAVEHTRKRLALFGHKHDVEVGDAENLPFRDDTFDIVYSWGVIHHSPDTPRAAREIIRVLKPGGRFAVMVYQTKSLVGAMLWARYALAAGKPFTPIADIYAQYLESPGTKAYSESEARALFAGAAEVRTRSVLSHGDLLESGAGQRHKGPFLAFARKVWPRALIRRFLPGWGLFLLVEGTK